MNYSLKIVTEPAKEPVSLAEVKVDRRMDAGPSPFDSSLEDKISSARRLVEFDTNRCLIEQTWDLLYRNGFPWLESCHSEIDPYEIRIPLVPLKAASGITHVKYLDTNGAQQTLAASAYDVISRGEPAIIVPVYGTSWPSTRDWPTGGNYPVEVRFICGYGTAASAVPAPLKRAILLLVGHWHENSEDVTDLNLATIPNGYEAIISRYRFFPR